MSSKPFNRFFDLFETKNLQQPEAEAHFIRPGQQIKSMRAWKENIDITIDFHEHTTAEAINSLKIHLERHNENHICLIIHGKGRNNKSILKNALLHYLQDNTRCYGYTPAPQNKGGTGATIVRFSKTH